MSYKIEGGYFSEVNGVRVIRRSPGQGTTSWQYRGFPTGIIFHFTAGCQDDIAGTIEAKGYGAQFCVGRDGSIYEYIEVGVATWHAYEASQTYWGIEHAALPGSCELTDVQLEASAKLAAALVEYTKDRWLFSIPLRKLVPPVTLADLRTRAGFLDHTDGPNAIEAGGRDNTWNKSGHTDRLYRWSWEKYFGAVSAALEGDDVSTQEIREGFADHKAGKPLNAAWSADQKFGWNLREQIEKAKTLPEPVPGPEGPAGPSGPPVSGTYSGTVTIP